MKAMCTKINAHVYVSEDMGVGIHVRPECGCRSIEVSSALLSSLFYSHVFGVRCNVDISSNCLKLYFL